MYKKILANAMALILIAGVAGTCNLAFVRAEDDAVSKSGSNTSENDVSASNNDATTSDNDADLLLGDVSGDGEVNYLDAILVLRYEAELDDFSAAQIEAGDVNGDGEVNYLDAINILRYEAELISSFDAVTSSSNDVGTSSSNDEVAYVG